MLLHRVLLALSLGLGLSAGVNAACSKALTVGLSDLGYGAYLDRGEIVGLVPDMLRELSRRSACEMVFTPRPRARALLDFMRGDIDILPSSQRTPDRDQVGVYLPYGYSEVSLLVRRDLAPGVDSLATLERAPRLRLGLLRGLRIGGGIDERLEPMIADKRVEYSADFFNLGDKLKAGRIQAALMPFIIHMKMQADGELGAAVRIIELPDLLPDVLGLYVRRESVTAADRELLQRHMAAMVREGWVQRLYARYVGEAKTRSVFSRGAPLQQQQQQQQQ